MEIGEGNISKKVKKEKKTRRTHHFYYILPMGRMPANKIPKEKET